MRPFTAVSAAAASVGVLVLAWNAGQSPAGAGTPTAGAAPAVATPGGTRSPATRGATPSAAPSATPPRASAPPPRPSAPAAAGSSGSSTAAAPPAPPAPAATRTVTGPSIMTSYGAVQVQVVLSGSRITDVVALHLTDSNRTSVQISARSAPTLRQEALTAQSAQIDAVSGATYTSTGYQQSLQAALDAAHA